MISRLSISISFLICIYSCGVQNKQEAIKDIYNNPISHISKQNDCIYYFENGNKVIAYLGGVEFNGGPDSLSTHLLMEYVKSPNYVNIEYNIIEHFIILFNKDLIIKDVRIVYREGYNNKRFYYDSIFIDAITRTTGLWHKSVKDKEWYVYLHRQRVY